MMSWGELIRRAGVRRAFVVAVSFAASFGIAMVATNRVSPWETVTSSYNVVLVNNGCQFSEVAAMCLREARRGSGEPSNVVAIPTDMEGEFSYRVCEDVRSALRSSGSFSTRVSMWVLPEKEWCQRLAEGSREWLLSINGKEQWPAFVRDGELVGVGLLRENFEAVGASHAGAHLNECIDAHMRRSQAGRS